jgi:signal transduction histidine kinase
MREIGLAAIVECMTHSIDRRLIMAGACAGLTVCEADRMDVMHGQAPAEAPLTAVTETAFTGVQARFELQMLADERRALRHVAKLVARGAAPREVFVAVAVEASRMLGGQATALLRYEPSGASAIVASLGGPDAPMSGTRMSACRDGVVERVFRTGRAARIDSYQDSAGPAAEGARRFGVGAAVGAPIVIEGRVWGALAVMARDRPLPAGTEMRLTQIAELVAGSIANAESRAELTASRARIVATADEARRRIERDVHDGAQQRLVHTIVTLKLAKAALDEAGSPAAELVSEALEQAERATAELRELVHGNMPAVLGSDGLRAAVESLRDQIAVPVIVDVPAERLPTAVETTAYLIIAEALTNVVKHAGAGLAHVRAFIDGNALEIEIRDNGRGGADPARGSGLTGLGDRVDASGGSIVVMSPPGEGTTIDVTLPIERDGHRGQLRASSRPTRR